MHDADVGLCECRCVVRAVADHRDGAIAAQLLDDGELVGGDEAQAIAKRQFDWLSSIPGTPRGPAGASRDYFVGLADMYVADDRFARHYGGADGANFVRDAIYAWTESDHH